MELYVSIDTIDGVPTEDEIEHSVTIPAGVSEDTDLCNVIAMGILFDSDWMPGTVEWSWYVAKDQ